MNRVQAVYEQTKSLLDVLAQLDKEKINRDQAMEQLTSMIEKREQLISVLTEPYTDEEKVIGRKIMVLNKQLEKEMSTLFEHIKVDMKKLKQNKDLNYSYINPYGKPKTTDGMYVDSKL